VHGSNSGADSTSGAFVVSDELVTRVRARDEAAFDALVDAAFEPLVRYAAGLSGSRESAEDLVQDVLCRVWELGPAWRPKGARAFLYGAVRNAAVNVLRRRNVEERFAARARSDPDAHLVDARPGPSEVVEAEETVQILRRALSELPDRQREALRLRYEERLTIPEVAHVMGVTVKSAEGVVARGVRALRARTVTAAAEPTQMVLVRRTKDESVDPMITARALRPI
jgi:RNA polymerase sigma factor (sigma-70 family)